MKNGRGATAAHLAAGEGSLEALEMLAHEGANLFAKDQRGRRPLHWAAEASKAERVGFILEYAGAYIGNMEKYANQTDQAGVTPLQLAFRSGDCDTVHELIKHGAKVNDISWNESFNCACKLCRPDGSGAVAGQAQVDRGSGSGYGSAVSEHGTGTGRAEA